MTELKIVKSKPVEEVISTLERLLADAKEGKINQLFYIVYIEEDQYIKGSAGKVVLDVHTELGMMIDLALDFRNNKIVEA